MSESYIRVPKGRQPEKWYNILADFPDRLPADQESDSNESSISLMNQIRIKELTKQDQSLERWIPIPDDILEKYEMVGRATPLMRAYALEKELGTPAEIYIKREDYLPTHSFKLNSAIAQAYYGSKEGYDVLVSESGAGQWGLALSYACAMYGMKNKFFWVRYSKEQKPFRADWCEIYGAEIYDSPSTFTKTGKKVLLDDPNCPGSLGISIGEAIEYVMEHPNCAYVSGSNLSHVLMHQTMIGLEAKEQFLEAGIKPDIFVACCGGGSNLGGFMAPFIFDETYQGTTRFFAAESDAAPRLSKGKYEFDSADPLGITPKVKSYTLGKDFIPPRNHVGGLRQHNGSPIIGKLKDMGKLEAKAYSQKEVLKAGRLFARLYGVLPAPESCHALKASIDMAMLAKQENRHLKITMCLSGNGVLDMNAYKGGN